jgi:hypothetical protein
MKLSTQSMLRLVPPLRRHRSNRHHDPGHEPIVVSFFVDLGLQLLNRWERLAAHSPAK